MCQVRILLRVFCSSLDLEVSAQREIVRDADMLNRVVESQRLIGARACVLIINIFRSQRFWAYYGLRTHVCVFVQIYQPRILRQRVYSAPSRFIAIVFSLVDTACYLELNVGPAYTLIAMVTTIDPNNAMANCFSAISNTEPLTISTGELSSRLCCLMVQLLALITGGARLPLDVTTRDLALYGEAVTVGVRDMRVALVLVEDEAEVTVVTEVRGHLAVTISRAFRKHALRQALLTHEDLPREAGGANHPSHPLQQHPSSVPAPSTHHLRRQIRRCRHFHVDLSAIPRSWSTVHQQGSTTISYVRRPQ
ncbi:hypothetical protein SS50377_25171 [Spironucleus salmonicida]|uniref:Uncharacterized protein n=1 Tax=Spironucleus salmonicida TaxID=348837 RepID=V6M0X3_9EUKA|nr:hypothetical protein SS50377_25171 [Spironucleus salmonicida]|eukprot:EST46799.1 Hypothetical protein SS50377_13164 [Spironucleus salmonicida]